MSTTTLIDGVTIQYLPSPEEVDTGRPLEAGKFLFPNFTRLFEPSSEVYGSRKRYKTGLDPETIENEEEKEQVKVLIKELEKHYGDGSLDPFNGEFWAKKSLKIERKTTRLNLKKQGGYFQQPDDVLTYFMIKGGAFPEIAPSYDSAVSGSIPKRWFLVEPNDFAEINAEDDRLLIKASSFLDQLETKKGSDDLFLIHKYLIGSDRGMTRRSPKGMIYKDLTNFIFGRLVKTNKRNTPKQFVDACELLKTDKKKLFVNAYVKDAIYYNFLQVLDDGSFKNGQTGAKYGTSIAAVVSYLMNPANQSELENMKERVEEKWDEK